MTISNGSFYKGLILVTGFAAVACWNRRPDHVLSQEQMVHVITEMYQYEGKLNALNLRRDSAEQIFALTQKAIFTRIGVDDSVFKLSYSYYLDHPAQLEEIYAVVVDSLSLREQRLQAKPDKP